MFLCLRSDEFCLHLLHLLCPFDSFWDWYGLLLLLELLDHDIDPFLFLVPPLDLWILFQPCPKLRCFIKKFSYCANLVLDLLQLHFCFMLPLLPDYWWSGWCELFSYILDLLLILINFLCNMINHFCFCDFLTLHDLWNLLISSCHFLLQSF
jgi:hypothetical protein